MKRKKWNNENDAANKENHNTLEYYYQDAVNGKAKLERMLEGETDERKIAFIKNSIICRQNTIENLMARVLIW